jgi:hypothetical protein
MKKPKKREKMEVRSRYLFVPLTHFCIILVSIFILSIHHKLCNNLEEKFYIYYTMRKEGKKNGYGAYVGGFWGRTEGEGRKRTNQRGR